MGDTAGASSSKIIKSLGLVFGDIGTSPIYTVGAILLFIVPTTFNMFGLLSLITWTLFTIITIQYIWLAVARCSFCSVVKPLEDRDDILEIGFHIPGQT